MVSVVSCHKRWFRPRDFHSKCDGHANTLTILKAKKSSNIFGGYTTVSWDSFSGDKSDPNAFIFSLTNKDNKPVKIYPDSHQDAIYCDPKCGPTLLIQLNIVILVWVVLLNIQNMISLQMKQKHFWPDHMIFYWMKLKFSKKNKK